MFHVGFVCDRHMSQLATHCWMPHVLCGFAWRHGMGRGSGSATARVVGWVDRPRQGLWVDVVHRPWHGLWVDMVDQRSGHDRLSHQSHVPLRECRPCAERPFFYSNFFIIKRGEWAEVAADVGSAQDVLSKGRWRT